jgi:N-acetylglucosamine-6-phosphate deacetylase
VKTLIYNARIILPDKIIQDGSVLIEDNIIKHVKSGTIDVEDCIKIDSNNNYLSPGFIDIHTHGAGGYDFMDGTEEAFLKIAQKHAEYGTTSLLPTTLACDMDELFTFFDEYKKAKCHNKMGADLVGIHLEGPYFALSQKGAQDAKYIKAPDQKEYEKILSKCDDILRWSSAPELEGTERFAKTLRDNNILPAIAHTDAVYEQIIKAYDMGFTHVTHLYSGMNGVIRKNAYRTVGAVQSAYLIDNMTVEIIADNVHLPGSLLQLVHKIKGPDKTALITDSMRGAGMPNGKSIIGSIHNGQEVIIEDGVAKMPDRSCFAGSVATTDRLVRTMINHAGVSLIDSVKMMTTTPAKIMSLSNRKGEIKEGMDADIVLFDENIKILMTMVQGKIVCGEPLSPIT